ncbi:hypothetical protein [Streptococcus moroccensis]|uniref:Archaellum biogenesis protein FlaJ (TadC family) n=1 Tax=Streptococcus moroccensis TaxID=1451356 RepID=A0ABT9YPI5_9STRE|nr:hypothetical protein [Streptococcus moroccensis]MDQ0221908.1 archaellum biogenesis protein FlaJ (TadC family) [Streptococcus moroccensis]
MQEHEKKVLEKRKQDAAIKTMYYNRYFMIRYVTVFFLVINLNWVAILYLMDSPTMMLIPCLLLVFAIRAMWEQYTMYTKDQKKARYTKYFHWTSMVINLVIIILVIFQQHQSLFPFIKMSLAGTITVISIQLIGLLLSSLVLVKLKKINLKKDKQYKRVKHYLASIKL